MSTFRRFSPEILADFQTAVKDLQAMAEGQKSKPAMAKAAPAPAPAYSGVSEPYCPNIDTDVEMQDVEVPYAAASEATRAAPSKAPASTKSTAPAASKAASPTKSTAQAASKAAASTKRTAAAPHITELSSKDDTCAKVINDMRALTGQKTMRASSMLACLKNVNKVVHEEKDPQRGFDILADEIKNNSHITMKNIAVVYDTLKEDDDDPFMDIPVSVTGAVRNKGITMLCTVAINTIMALDSQRFGDLIENNIILDEKVDSEELEEMIISDIVETYNLGNEVNKKGTPVKDVVRDTIKIAWPISVKARKMVTAPTIQYCKGKVQIRLCPNRAFIMEVLAKLGAKAIHLDSVTVEQAWTVIYKALGYTLKKTSKKIVEEEDHE